MLELSSRRTATPQASVAEIKDRDFWFGDGSATIQSDTPEAPAAVQTPIKAVQPSQAVPAAPTPKKQMTPTVVAQGTPEEAPAITTKRTILPPLNVEVVAGSKHSSPRPGNNATKLEIATPATKSAPQIEAATNAAQHEALADATKPAYPPLAQHMNVQGSVVLQALIGADGTIENLRVTSGPAILATAAQQAVRQWRFKPIMQNGQAVESKATITVNFTIKVADDSANATIAESRPEQILILTR